MKVAGLVLAAGIESEDFPVDVAVVLAVELAVKFVKLPPANDVVNGTNATGFSDDSDEDIDGLNHAYDDSPITVVGTVISLPAFVLVTPVPHESVTGVFVPV